LCEHQSLLTSRQTVELKLGGMDGKPTISIGSLWNMHFQGIYPDWNENDSHPCGMIPARSVEQARYTSKGIVSEYCAACLC
jgi:hypothetical protein